LFENAQGVCRLVLEEVVLRVEVYDAQMPYKKRKNSVLVFDFCLIFY
jgi:hypothetical protein